MLIAKTLKVYTNNAPKNKTNPNSKNFVIDLGITIFLNEYVGIVLISNIEVIIKNDGTNMLGQHMFGFGVNISLASWS